MNHVISTKRWLKLHHAQANIPHGRYELATPNQEKQHMREPRVCSPHPIAWICVITNTSARHLHNEKIRAN
ncbi:hypothetical protein EUGRSUZ_A02550 [Eucalyptus grandis]|uniref:Uncharacterized protein n=2 Tax=Eucalyptus grandis TaxID=71139 RepID=A0ACC3M6T5_EUCGR|nr:hypothetical protein EUGRSUZ_A02550 [Eucalyptus grandis]